METITVTEEKTRPEAIYVGLKLNKRTDADILSEIGEGTTRQVELKRLIRLGMKELGHCREDKKRGLLGRK